MAKIPQTLQFFHVSMEKHFFTGDKWQMGTMLNYSQEKPRPKALAVSLHEALIENKVVRSRAPPPTTAESVICDATITPVLQSSTQSSSSGVKA